MAPGLMRGAPTGAVGAVSKSGWTDSEIFIQWLKHFADNTKSSKTNPQLIILDGHHSHKTLAAVDFARDNGITLLTLPPHSTHKLQPLDRTIFKTLKCNYNRVCDNWMTCNAGKRITVFDMAELFCKAYDKTAGIEAAKKGFETTGLWPFDDQKFTDDDFVAAEVTDEPLTTMSSSVTADSHVNTDSTTSTVSAAPNTGQSAAAVPITDGCSLHVPDGSNFSAAASESENRDFVAAEVTDEPPTTMSSSVQVTADSDGNTDSTISTVNAVSNTGHSSTAAAASTTDGCTPHVPGESNVLLLG